MLYKVRLLAVIAGALNYAEIDQEADTKQAAAEAVEKGIADGDIKPGWHPTSGDLKDPNGDAVHIHDIVGDHADFADQGEIDAANAGGGKPVGGTGPNGGVIPTNTPVDPVNTRLTRNTAPLHPDTRKLGDPIPAKARPGEIPMPTVENTNDGTKSPTPAADGVTHLPAGQRSQAVPGPRTGVMGQAADRNPNGRAAGDTAALKPAAAEDKTTTRDTGGPAPENAAETEQHPEPEPAHA